MFAEDGRKVPFVRRQATRALTEAMSDLALRSGQPLDEMENMPLGEAYELAVRTYDTLPDFWRIWNDWQQVRPSPMGQL